MRISGENTSGFLSREISGFLTLPPENTQNLQILQARIVIRSLMRRVKIFIISVKNQIRLMFSGNPLMAAEKKSKSVITLMHMDFLMPTKLWVLEKS